MHALGHARHLNTAAGSGRCVEGVRPAAGLIAAIRRGSERKLSGSGSDMQLVGSETQVRETIAAFRPWYPTSESDAGDGGGPMA